MWRICEKIERIGENPLPLSLAKLFLRVEGGEEDALILLLMDAVMEGAEHAIRGSIALSDWRLRYGADMPLCVHLPMGPVVEVQQVKVFSASGSETLVDEESYSLTGTGERLQFHRRISAHAVEITYRAGYADVPAPLVQAMLLHLGYLFEMRSEAGEMPAHVRQIYDTFRMREV